MRGAIIDVRMGFGLGILSYNKSKFEKNGINYTTRTYMFMFFKYEIIEYRIW
jgi:hypothetical protein